MEWQHKLVLLASATAGMYGLFHSVRTWQRLEPAQLVDIGKLPATEKQALGILLTPNLVSTMSQRLDKMIKEEFLLNLNQLKNDLNRIDKRKFNSALKYMTFMNDIHNHIIDIDKNTNTFDFIRTWHQYFPSVEGDQKTLAKAVLNDTNKNPTYIDELLNNAKVRISNVLQIGMQNIKTELGVSIPDDTKKQELENKLKEMKFINIIDAPLPDLFIKIYECQT